MIDLRSDTKTRPTPEMYQAMVEAPVGDDMDGEDPTVNRLQERVAEMFGKEAALFGVSGTMTNQLGIRCHCGPGDELLIHRTGHIANYEGGAPAAMSGITCRLVGGERGMPTPEDFEAELHPEAQHYPRTRLVCLENSTNMGGGAAWPIDRFREAAGWARERGFRVHLDGARLFNACVARGYTPADLTAEVDTISICFSKGLGCPMGSMLIGSADDICKAFRARKLFGGALRQSGIIAGAALFALDHHIDRLSEDHANARLMADQIAAMPGLRCDPATVETNILFFELDSEIGTPQQLATAVRERGVVMMPAGPRTIRVCTHLDVTRDDIKQAAGVLGEELENLRQSAKPVSLVRQG
nr:GntG family PLP-dependent aldolase [Stratiformator vulcanicus]